MSKLKEFQERARDLARSGAFYALPPLEFELQFEDGYDEAREWLEDSETRDELDRLCRELSAQFDAKGRLGLLRLELDPRGDLAAAEIDDDDLWPFGSIQMHREAVAVEREARNGGVARDRKVDSPPLLTPAKRGTRGAIL